jgi:hypothetical protein
MISKYLKGTYINLGLLFTGIGTLNVLIAYTNNDFTMELDDKCSRTIFALFWLH